MIWMMAPNPHHQKSDVDTMDEMDMMGRQATAKNMRHLEYISQHVMSFFDILISTNSDEMKHMTEPIEKLLKLNIL